LTALKDGEGPVSLGRGGLKQTRFASSSKMKNLIDEDSTAKRSLFENSHLETSGAYLPELKVQKGSFKANHGNLDFEQMFASSQHISSTRNS